MACYGGTLQNAEPCCPQPGCQPDTCKPGCTQERPPEDDFPIPEFTCPPPKCPLPPECQTPPPPPAEEEKEPEPEPECEPPKEPEVTPDAPTEETTKDECDPDADPEAERPTGWIEMLSGTESWLDYGIKVVCTSPTVPGNPEIRVGQPIYLMVCVEAESCIRLNPNFLSCWCWTHMKTDCNKCGVWKEVYMSYSPCDTEYGQNVHRFVFRGSITPRATDQYKLTFNLKWLEKNLLLWVDDFKKRKHDGGGC